MARVAMHMGLSTLVAFVLVCGLSTAKKSGEDLNAARQRQGVNSTVSAKSLAAELISLTKYGAEFAAQGITHVQRVGLTQGAKDAWDVFRPGGQLHPQYFLEHKWNFIFEGILLVVIAYMFLQRSGPKKKQDRPLSEKEIDELCDDWQPEPLFSQLTEAQKAYEPPVVSSAPGVMLTVNGKKALNMVSSNFLGVAGDPKIQAACQETVKKYGIGSCGPRGFYGTIDVHLTLEERLAKFMGTEESIIYSYDLATIPSVIPAFANAKDVIVCDEGVSYPIQNGCTLSRASVKRFWHNDVADLERTLQSIDREHRHLKKPLNRRFIVVEGIYTHSGHLAPLDEIYKLKEKYKYRLVVDESLALGVLGRHGRGACEHWGLQPGDAEIVSASMGNALASVGGFCAGDREIVDHQRLSGLGYCFSASLPPFLATAAVGALDVLESRADTLLPALEENSRLLRSRLAEVSGIHVEGGDREAVSPVVHVRLAEQPTDASEAEEVLQQVVDTALRKGGVLMAVNRLSKLDAVKSAPSIRLVATAAHTEKHLAKAVAALDSAIRSLKRIPLGSASP